MFSCYLLLPKLIVHAEIFCLLVSTFVSFVVNIIYSYVLILMKVKNMDEIVFSRSNAPDVVIDKNKHTLSSGRFVINFTPIEWRILYHLYTVQPRVVSRTELVSVVWGKQNGWATRTIDVHVGHIRKKLSILRGARIDSVYGGGYRFVFLNRV